MDTPKSVPGFLVVAILIGAVTLGGCASKQLDPQIALRQKAEQDRIATEKARQAARDELARAEAARQATDQLLQEAAAAEEKARQDRERARRAEKLQLIIR